jgi:hypothetical protein
MANLNFKKDFFIVDRLLRSLKNTIKKGNYEQFQAVSY